MYKYKAFEDKDMILYLFEWQTVCFFYCTKIREAYVADNGPRICKK